MKFKDIIKKQEDMAEDKIINNSFNSGEVSFQEFTQAIKIDSRVSDNYEDQLGDVIEHRSMKALNDIIYDIFKDSEFFEKYKNPKRVDKNDMIKMYYFFKAEIAKGDKTFSSMEKFIGFAEFFQINYDQLYNEIRVSDKEDLLKELNEKYGLNKKIKTKRLF
jgi:hypothetical protein